MNKINVYKGSEWVLFVAMDSEVSSPPRQPARVAVNIKKARNRGVLLRMTEPFVLSICSLAGLLRWALFSNPTGEIF